MAQPKWIDPKISFGHIMQAFLLIGGGLFAFFELKENVRHNSDRITAIEKIQAIEIGHIKESLKRIERYQTSSVSR